MIVVLETQRAKVIRIGVGRPRGEQLVRIESRPAREEWKGAQSEDDDRTVTFSVVDLDEEP